MLESTLAGLTSGGAYALLGVCLVLMYRMVGVVNFAQASLGAFGAYVTVSAHDASVSYGAAALLGILSGMALAALAGLVMTLFLEAGDAARSTVAIALLIGLVTGAYYVFGHEPLSLPSLVVGAAFTVGDTVVTWAAVLAALLAVALAGVAAIFLGCTRTGLRLQALSERPVTAALLGVPVRPLAVGVWAGGGAVATVAILIVAPTRSSDFLSLSLLVLPGLAAALVGLFRDLWLTVAGGLLLGLLEGLLASFQSISDYRTILPFAVILAVLLWSNRRERFDAAR